MIGNKGNNHQTCNMYITLSSKHSALIYVSLITREDYKQPSDSTHPQHTLARKLKTTTPTPSNVSQGGGVARITGGCYRAWEFAFPASWEVQV